MVQSASGQARSLILWGLRPKYFCTGGEGAEWGGWAGSDCERLALGGLAAKKNLYFREGIRLLDPTPCIASKMSPVDIIL